MPGWHVPELAKGVTHKPRHSHTQGRATRKAVRKNCNFLKVVHAHVIYDLHSQRS
jgi:hypothetical protein